MRKNYYKDIEGINLSDLTPADVQLMVSKLSAEGKSPKTIKNVHGLLSYALEMYRPDFNLKTRLPQNQKFELRVFSEEEMAKVWAQAKGSKYELPILLASWMGLRMSEIRGLRYSDISDGKIHVHTAIVAGPDGDVEKGPKTEAGDRWIKIPDVILKLIFPNQVNSVNEQAYICPYADITIYKNFINICKKAGVEPCRFHDLRHFAASEAHALGVPDKYAMRRMGHKTDNMLKTVYQHTLRDKEDEFGDLIDSKMEKLYNSADENADE
jgi:integrase